MSNMVGAIYIIHKGGKKEKYIDYLVNGGQPHFAAGVLLPRRANGTWIPEGSSEEGVARSLILSRSGEFDRLGYIEPNKPMNGDLKLDSLVS